MTALASLLPNMPRSFAGTLDSRAMARAIRFAAEPPPVSVPVKRRQPIASASQRTTVRSMVTPAGAERHAVMFWFDEIAQGGDRFGGTLHVTEEASVLSATVGNHAGQGGERGLA